MCLPKVRKSIILGPLVVPCRLVGRSGLVDLGELLWVFDVGRSLCRLFGYYGSLAVSR